MHDIIMESGLELERQWKEYLGLYTLADLNEQYEKGNIKEIKAIGSRLNLVLLDKEKINRGRLKELGVTSILVMSNKVTLVIEGQAEKIASSIQKDL